MQKSNRMKRGIQIQWMAICLGSLFLFSIPQFSIAQETVIASTSLVGAIAKAAGAKEVQVLTPVEMRHPPEYELMPSDLLKFQRARVIIYGGYERMVPKLLETSKNRNILAIQIDTETSPENLMNQVRKVSKILGTQKEEKAWEERFIERLKILHKRLFLFSGKRTVVHRFASPFANWAGLSIVQMISPGELTPKAVADGIAQKPELVVDVLHFPVARVIAENAKCKYIQIINFPGVENTKTLEDVFEYNSIQVIKAFQ
jgi:zinc transport system substrate-binding protein/iron/zinc/copper transport system substrate-binding protein